jgi:hypothetical protein
LRVVFLIASGFASGFFARHSHLRVVLTIPRNLRVVSRVVASGFASGFGLRFSFLQGDNPVATSASLIISEAQLGKPRRM